MKIDNSLILEYSWDLNVLYVEEDEINKDDVIKNLSKFFKRIDTASNGLDGYNKFKSLSEKNGSGYDIVFVDFIMSKMSGLELAEELKKIKNDQAIIFLTVFGDVPLLHQALEIGADGFLLKPIEFEKLKNILYRVCLNLVNRKLLDTHYYDLEEQVKLDSAMLGSTKDIYEVLHQHQEQISIIWTQNLHVQKRLNKHSIDVEYFRKHFGTRVVDYFLNVINESVEVGNCPVIIAMLDFFKHKDLSMQDIYEICVNFKNSVVTFVFNRFYFNEALYTDLSYILDKNFEGVITNYLKLKDERKRSSELRATFSCEQKKVTVQESENHVLNGQVKLDDSKEQIEHIDYKEYMIESDIYELEELENDIDNLAIILTENKISTIDEIHDLGYKIERYGIILSNYPLFQTLGAYVVKLGMNFIKNAQILHDDREKLQNISTLVESFVNDLIFWRKEIFEKNNQDPYFLNNSFLSNVDTIIMFIEYDPSQEEILDDSEEFIEFF
jgi:YesN/AraC family two-component response regulator